MFVVKTQILENYGAHCEDGKFASGNAYWKFKGGNDYVVTGLDRIQDAVAYVAAICIDNSLGWKEFPIEYKTYDEWVDELDTLDNDYREFILEQALHVNPEKMKEAA
jgi:hypothetical protein|tara:strand:- start:1806 stop:2126 length:321 start_codon:yes stop_codon:yes gene_type:complete